MTTLQSIIETNYRTRSYSGRGMYGKGCLGVVVKGSHGVGKLMAHIVAEIGHLVSDTADAETVDDTCKVIDGISAALKYMVCDSMGMDTIVYFPDVSYVDPDEGEDDEEDDSDD